MSAGSWLSRLGGGRRAPADTSGAVSSVRAAYDARVAEGLRRDPGQEALVARLDGLRETMVARGRKRGWLPGRNRPPPDGLYVWGDVGRGKSMLVDMLIAGLGTVPAKRSHFHAFMRDIHEALHVARREGRDDPVATAADAVAGRADLLVLDEVEITDIADAMIVGRVFEHLVGQGIVFVATSNSAPVSLYRDGLKREHFLPFVRLIETRCEVVHLEGAQDYRDRDDPDGGVLSMTGDGAAARRMEALWHDIPAGEESFTLSGRTDLRRKGTAVRGSFDALCRAPLAASDYIALAERAEIVFVEDIPLLGERDNDATRRFILLIDALYDARRGVVVTAAAEPGPLHRDGEFTQEFRRTASRLNEMTRPDWLARAGIR